MTLDQWQKREGVLNADVARAIGRDASTVGRIRSGKTVPDWLTLERLARYTKGAVMPNDFLKIRIRYSKG